MTRFSADWHARRELSVLESERKLVDKTCGVGEFVATGMGTAMMDLGASKTTSGGVESRHAHRECATIGVKERAHTVTGRDVPVSDLSRGSVRPAHQSHAAGDAGSGNAPTRTSPRCDSSSAVVAPSERDVLAAVIRALALHPKVAWATRMNVGAFKDGDRFVRFGFKGCSDVIGQMTDGRFLAVEVKRPGGKPSENQLSFLCRVQRAGGVAFVAWSVSDVARGLA